ncbi:hypothetical protein [Streptomyces sp. RFCAC02]|uniref:hypothetical protein n=1 Tax=Streptomyces sp. RFCAC02 TaxID=2499143 RepID=UPI00101EA80F|nr:hypothetical protein [Streptomyces sp. RFCAC02]
MTERRLTLVGRDSARQGVSVRTAVRFGALVALAQVAVAELFLVVGVSSGSGVAALHYAVITAGLGAAYYRVPGPRASATSPRSAGRRLLFAALLYGVLHGVWLFVVTMVALAFAIEAPPPVAYVVWYLVLAAALAGTLYRLGRRSARRTMPAPTARPVDRRAAKERGRASEGSGAGSAEWRRAGYRARVDPERQARNAERAITEFGALLSVHPFTPGDLGTTYRHLADHSLALDAYERAKSAPPADVPGILAEGRVALERLDRRLGLDSPAPEGRCFFDQRHGPAVESVRWAPPGGVARTVEVCRADAVRLADGDLPDGR